MRKVLDNGKSADMNITQLKQLSDADILDILDQILKKPNKFEIRFVLIILFVAFDRGLDQKTVTLFLNAARHGFDCESGQG